MRDDPYLIGLVTRARAGDQRAWDALVDRYAALVWSICRRNQLSRADAEDVGQNVWLHLVEQLDNLRDPAALAGWLATTTQRECSRALRAVRGPQAAGQALDSGNIPDEKAGIASRNCSSRSGTQRSAKRSPACRRTASDFWRCSSKTLLCLTPRSARRWASRWAASGPPAGAA